MFDFKLDSFKLPILPAHIYLPNKNTETCVLVSTAVDGPLYLATIKGTINLLLSSLKLSVPRLTKWINEIHFLPLYSS